MTTLTAPFKVLIEDSCRLHTVDSLAVFSYNIIGNPRNWCCLRNCKTASESHPVAATVYEKVYPSTRYKQVTCRYKLEAKS